MHGYFLRDTQLRGRGGEDNSSRGILDVTTLQCRNISKFEFVSLGDFLEERLSWRGIFWLVPQSCSLGVDRL